MDEKTHKARLGTNPDRTEPDLDFLIPTEGQLRYIEFPEPKCPVRILQRYEWSYHLNEFRWFDVFVERGE